MGEIMIALALLLTGTAMLLWLLVRSERHPPSKRPSSRRSPDDWLPKTQRRAVRKRKTKSSKDVSN